MNNVTQRVKHGNATVMKGCVSYSANYGIVTCYCCSCQKASTILFYMLYTMSNPLYIVVRLSRSFPRDEYGALLVCALQSKRTEGQALSFSVVPCLKALKQRVKPTPTRIVLDSSNCPQWVLFLLTHNKRSSQTYCPLLATVYSSLLPLFLKSSIV